MSTKINLLPAVKGKKKAVITDQKPSGVNGGTFTQGSFITRTLNTIEGDTDIVSLNSNQFTIQPGTYLIWGSAPAYYVNYHKVQLYDITNSMIKVQGMSSYATIAGSTSSTKRSFFTAYAVLTVPTTYEVRHRCSSTSASTGLGIASSMGEVEIYTEVSIIQLEEA